MSYLFSLTLNVRGPSYQYHVCWFTSPYFRISSSWCNSTRHYHLQEFAFVTAQHHEEQDGSLRRQDISNHNIDYMVYVDPGLTWGRIWSTCVISMWSNDIKCKYMFMFPLKNVARKGLDYNMTGPLIHHHPSQFTFWNIYFTIYASIENTQKCIFMKKPDNNCLHKSMTNNISQTITHIYGTVFNT